MKLRTSFSDVAKAWKLVSVIKNSILILGNFLAFAAFDFLRKLGIRDNAYAGDIPEEGPYFLGRNNLFCIEEFADLFEGVLVSADATSAKFQASETGLTHRVNQADQIRQILFWIRQLQYLPALALVPCGIEVFYGFLPTRVSFKAIIEFDIGIEIFKPVLPSFRLLVRDKERIASRREIPELI